MNHLFSQVIDRRGTNSLKWEVKEGELPMWVADMDFPTAPAITKAIERKAASGVYGYGIVPPAYRQAVSQWWARRYHWAMEEEWVLFCDGVIPALASLIRHLTQPGDKVLIQPPVYNNFAGCIVNTGRIVSGNDLVYQDGAYQIDWEDLERRLADPQVTLMILCNPHNPVGKFWDRETLERIGELCWQHHVVVISDEIHCDLTDPGCTYVPFASVSERCAQNCVVTVTPTKTFNLAGLQTASVVAPNPHLREKVKWGLETDKIDEPNSFAVEAAIAAYSQGEPWLEALRQYIWENKKAAQDFLEKKLPEVTLVSSQATYLLWLDCTSVTGKSKELAWFLRRETGLYLLPGSIYGGNGGHFLRMNIACPRTILEDGLERLYRGVSSYRSWPEATR